MISSMNRMRPSLSTGQDDLQILRRIFEQRLLGRSAETDNEFPPPPNRAELIRHFSDLLRRLSSLMRIQDARGSGLDAILSNLISITNDALGTDRSTLFLYDRETDELFSRIAQGDLTEEIRFPATRGVAGTVFSTGTPMLISDAYADPRFNPEIDELTGYHTRSILCAPVRTWNGHIIGVVEALNKLQGAFDTEDQALLEALTSHAAAALESTQLYESVEKSLRDEVQLLEISTTLNSELNLDTLLDRILAIATEVLDADRSTLLLYDEKSDELRSKVAEGLGEEDIRIPAETGIAGSVFRTRKTVNIADAYADPRFNPEVDRRTGYRTHSILCAPVVAQHGRIIGIIEVLNRRGGPFGRRDERRIEALAAQAAIAIENARLFEQVLDARNYNEGVLRSLSNGVVTLDSQRHVITANPAALHILQRPRESVVGQPLDSILPTTNALLFEALDRVCLEGRPETTLDVELHLMEGRCVPVNLTIQPLTGTDDAPLGFTLVLEDITREKRIKGTMARYMSAELSERLLELGEEVLEGTAQEVTVLFSDIRDFTRLTEDLGPRATVSMLNSYFSDMAELVFDHQGILDKYIGDAIMAVFGTPFPDDRDADNAVRVAIGMLDRLREFNLRRQLQGQEPIDIRLGLSTGEVIAGNIGSRRRMDYTVIGHPVNVASRLEQANKYYGTRILVAGTTVEHLQDSYRLRELDLIRVKGATQPVKLFEILEGLDPLEHPSPEALLEAFSAGLTYYRARDWRKATDRFVRALGVWPGDGPSRLYLNRCAQYSVTPPPDDWDGVWDLDRG